MKIQLKRGRFTLLLLSFRIMHSWPGLHVKIECHGQHTIIILSVVLPSSVARPTSPLYLLSYSKGKKSGYMLGCSPQ